MREHSVNSQNNFIMGWYAEDHSFIDELLDFHQKSEIKHTDWFSSDIKESVDVSIPLTSQTSYWKHLDLCFGKYFEKYDEARSNSGMDFTEEPNIQYYKIGGGFKVWHCERVTDKPPNGNRHLVFMTYLNDVPDGGTEFLYQNLKIKAERGLTIIWPSDWMFTHKGEISNTKEKWIITGWIHLKDKQNENRNL